MKILIKKKKSFTKKDDLIVLNDKNSDLSQFKLTISEINFIKKSKKKSHKLISIADNYL